MNDWDPMMSDYNDSYFNRYNQGVGRNLTAGNMSSAQIFVDNFPVDFGEEGLVNMFSDFGNVLSAQLKPSNRPDRRHTYGFVVMADPAGAAEAISVLNGRKFHFSPLPLKVKPAITNDEKERRKVNKQIEREILGPYADFDMYSLSNESQRRRPLEYDFPNLRSLASGDSRNLNGPIGLGWGPGGNVPFGRGRPMGHQMRGPMAPFGGRGQRLREYISHDPGRERGAPRPQELRSPPLVSHGSSLKICILCGKEGSTNRCSRCKMHYCSLECQRKDWPNHRNICIDVSLHHQTLYGAEPMQNQSLPLNEGRKGNKYSDAPGAWPGNKENQKSEKKAMPERKSDFGRKDSETRQKNQSTKMFGNKSKSDTKDKAFESDGARGSNKENSDGQQQNRPTNKSNANNSQRDNDLDKKGPGPNSRSMKTSEESRNKESEESSKKKFNKGKNQTKENNNQGERKDFGADGSSGTSKTQTKTGSEPKGGVKSPAKNQKKRVVEKDNEHKPGDIVAEGSGDAPGDIECEALPLNSSETCYVSHYESPDLFWLIRDENMITFLEATQLFTECIRDVPEIPMKDLKAGNLCCLLYDGEWTRGRVLKMLGDGKASVIFFDYGSKDVVDVSDLKPLVQEMLFLPAQAIPCCVSGLKPKQRSTWSEAANEAVKGWIGEILTKKMNVTHRAKQGGKCAVEVSSDEATPKLLEDLLLNWNHAEKFVGKADDGGKGKALRDPKRRFKADDLKSVREELKIGQKININIVDFKSAGNFLGQVFDKITALPKLEEQLEKLNLDQEAPYEPVVGEIVLAKFCADNKWYRSEVTEVKGSTYKITFLDYGNEESVRSQSIRHIQHPALLEFPRFAVSFGFHGIDRIASSKERLDEFAVLLEDYTIETGVWRVVILEKRDSVVFVDFLSKNKLQPLSEVLDKKFSSTKQSPQPKTVKSSAADSPKKPSKSPQVESPQNSMKSLSANSPQESSKSPTTSSSKNPPPLTFPKSSRSPEGVKPQTSFPVGSESLPSCAETLTSVNVFYVVNFEKFYVGLSDKQNAINEMMIWLHQNQESLKPFENAQIGSVAIAPFEVDSLLYRVKLLSVEDETCSVFFLDYGNIETMKTASLLALPDSVTAVPAQALHCCLDNESGKSQNELLEHLNTCIESNEIVHVRVCRKEGDRHIVQVCKEDGSLYFQSGGKTGGQEKKKPQVVTPMLSDVDVKEPKDTDLDVHCAHFESINEFYCFTLDDILGLNALSEQMQAHYDAIEEAFEGEPVIGGLYGCCFESQWYRCVVEQCKSKTVTIRYIDFGNTEDRPVTDLRSLDHEFLTLPVSLFQCKLHGIKLTGDDKNSEEMVKYNNMVKEKLKEFESHVTIKGNEGKTLLVSLSLSSKEGHSVDIASDLVGVSLAQWIGATQSPKQTEGDDKQEEEKEEEDEDDLKMRELMRQMEELKMKKKTKTAK